MNKNSLVINSFRLSISASRCFSNNFSAIRYKTVSPLSRKGLSLRAVRHALYPQCTPCERVHVAGSRGKGSSVSPSRAYMRTSANRRLLRIIVMLRWSIGGGDARHWPLLICPELLSRSPLLRSTNFPLSATRPLFSSFLYLSLVFQNVFPLSLSLFRYIYTYFFFFSPSLYTYVCRDIYLPSWKASF